MNNLYGNNLYLQNQIDFENMPIIDSFVIDDTLVNNPARICLRSYGDLQNLDILMLANNIKNPYKDLSLGTVIVVPDLSYVNSTNASQANLATTIKLKNVNVSGTTITY